MRTYYILSAVASMVVLAVPTGVYGEVIFLGDDGMVRHGRAWGPEQALGPPDTPGAGDIRTAWASETQDGQDEWLDLEFEHPVLPTEVVVHETYNPGALSRVTAYTKSGMEAELWAGKDPTPSTAARGISRVKVDPGFEIQRIRIHLKSTEIRGWNEIDAVGLTDKSGKVHWAVAAKASSTYAGDPATGTLPKALREAAKSDGANADGADAKPAFPGMKPLAVPRVIVHKSEDDKADDHDATVREELAKMRDLLAAREVQNAELLAKQALLEAELQRARAVVRAYEQAIQRRQERAEVPR